MQTLHCLYLSSPKGWPHYRAITIVLIQFCCRSQCSFFIHFCPGNDWYHTICGLPLILVCERILWIILETGNGFLHSHSLPFPCHFIRPTSRIFLLYSAGWPTFSADFRLAVFFSGGFSASHIFSANSAKAHFLTANAYYLVYLPLFYRVLL